MKKLKLIADHEEFKANDIIEVSEELAAEMIEKEIAVEFEEKVEEKSIDDLVAEKVAAKIAEIEAKEVKEVKEITEKKEIPTMIEVKEQKLSPEKKLHNAFIASKALATNKWTEEAKAIVGQGETTDADGGYLVDNDIVSDIYRYAMETSFIANKVAQRPVGQGYNTLQLRTANSANATPADYQGVALAVVSEGAAITPDKVPFVTKTAAVNKLAALFAETNEIAQDVPGMASYLSKTVGEAFGLVLDDEILHGTKSLLTALVDDASVVDITGAATPTVAMIANMYMGAINPAQSEWYMSGAAYAALMNLNGADSRPMIQMNYALSPFGTLLGRPVNVVPCMKAIASSGAILFADLGNAYTLGTKGGVNFANSVHLYFNTDQMAYRWVLRVAGVPSKSTTLTLADGRKVAAAVQWDRS